VQISCTPRRYPAITQYQNVYPAIHKGLHIFPRKWSRGINTRNFRTRRNTGLTAPPELVFVFLDEMNNRSVDIITASDRRISHSPVQLNPTLRLSLTETSLSFSVYLQALHQHVQHLLQTIQTRQQQLVPKTVKSTVEVQFTSQDVQAATYGHCRVDAASCMSLRLLHKTGLHGEAQGLPL